MTDGAGTGPAAASGGARDVRAVVRWWLPEQGWGVVDCEETPGGCWVHFAHIATEGYRELEPAATVRLEFERADQDGSAYRATRVWPDGSEPVEPSLDEGPPGAYPSRLTIRWDVPRER